MPENTLMPGDLASESFVGLLDLTGIVVQCNRPELTGHPIWDAPWWPDAPEYFDQLQHAIGKASRGKPVLFEIDVSGKPVQFSLEPVLGGEGQIGFLLAKAMLAHKAFLSVAGETVDSRAVFKQALNNLSSFISSANAAVQIENLPRVQMQEAHLLQVFQNIVGNAIKFRGYRPLYITARGRGQGRFCEFSIEDNGIGIDLQSGEPIFQSQTGDRIGLPTCRQIVEEYGGRIWVQSMLDHGATFFFTVPAA